MLLPQMVNCPYCGEMNEIDIDPSGGKRQDYEEDCQVCCRPWKVHVRMHGSGSATVHLSTMDEVAGDE